jgi:GntR family transcriptional regulator, transcriptional repressor for pyruvate dehydrogenase complex
MALTFPEGELIGSEDDVIAHLGVSRVTVRQAARLLERDGLLLVKRGKKGGYFSARPGLDMMEAVVCAYLETLGIGAAHTGGVATALWVESVRQATLADRTKAIAAARKLQDLVEALPPEASMGAIAEAEHAFRGQIFDLIDGNYLRTIFQINAAFSRSHLPADAPPISEDQHREFLRKWRSAKLLQCEAIASGDMLQGVLAALHDRNAWTQRGARAWKDASDGPTGSQGARQPG